MKSFKNINKKTKFKYKTIGYGCTTFADGNDFLYMEWNKNLKLGHLMVQA